MDACTMSTTHDPRPNHRPKSRRDIEQYDYPWHDPETVANAYDETGTVIGVANRFGIDETTARRSLERYTDYEPKEYGAHLLDDLDPEDVPALGGDA